MVWNVTAAAALLKGSSSYSEGPECSHHPAPTPDLSPVRRTVNVLQTAAQRELNSAEEEKLILLLIFLLFRVKERLLSPGSVK